MTKQGKIKIFYATFEGRYISKMMDYVTEFTEENSINVLNVHQNLFKDNLIITLHYEDYDDQHDANKPN